jgi:hypothetical protein
MSLHRIEPMLMRAGGGMRFQTPRAEDLIYYRVPIVKRVSREAGTTSRYLARSKKARRI